MGTVLIGPRHQVAAGAKLQFLKRWPILACLNRFHFDAAFWTRVVPEGGIDGCVRGVAIILGHGEATLCTTQTTRLSFPKRPKWQATCGEKGMKKQHPERQSEGIRTYDTVAAREPGLGPGSAGQSGDTQGLSDVAEADSESVLELVEEGQSFEAEVISGVEDAPDPDVAEVHTRQVKEDDVPSEYLEEK